MTILVVGVGMLLILGVVIAQVVSYRPPSPDPIVEDLITHNRAKPKFVGYDQDARARLLAQRDAEALRRKQRRT